ncbi:DUF6599 family protein [Candidatus Latescibacterota bacterium]
MKKILFTFIVALLTAGCLFPVPNDTRSLLQSDEEFSLTGIKETYEALSIRNHIPSDAGIYVEFGADSCFVAEFSRGNERYTVDAYSFLTEKGALGAYFITGLAGSMSTEMGYYARKSGSAIQFVKGKNIILVSNLNGGTIEGAVELASVLEKRIGGGRIVPDLYLSLPKTNIIENSKLYFTGLRGFESRFSPDLRKALQVQYALNGTAGKYIVGTRVVDLIRLRFSDRGDVKDGIDSYLNSRKDRPIIHAMETRNYNIVVEEDKSEVYIAEYGDVLYMMLGAAPDKKGQEFFEYVLRGGK